MATAAMSGKGRITIPANVRLALGMEAGGRVEFVEVAPGRFEIHAATHPVTALKGMFGRCEDPGVSVEEMDAAIKARAVAEK